ncbi:hypothetical protein [Mucilaginibacter paludis]|nr:hypothetical protein [Mucilaginibacter paludis]
METLQKVQPVLGGGSIKPFLNVGGMLDIYTSGTDLKVFRLRPAGDEKAPYTAADLGIQASQLSLFLSTEGDANSPAILGLDTGSRLTISTIKNGAYQQRLFEPANEVGRKLKSFIATRSPTGAIYVTAILEDDKLVNNMFNPSTDPQWKSKDWVQVKNPASDVAKVRELSTVANNDVQGSLFAIGLPGTSYDGRLLFSESRYRDSPMVDLLAPLIKGKPGKIAHFSVVEDKSKLINILAVESETGELYQKKQKKPLSGMTKTEFEDWKKIDSQIAGTFNPFNTKLKSLQATLRFDNTIEIFAIGLGGDLHYTYLQKAGKYWSVLFPLGSQFNNTNYVLTRSLQGYSEVYSITTANEIIRFFQSPESQQWFTNKVLVEGVKKEVISVQGHSVDLTILDANGVPQPNTNVILSTSYQTPISANGLFYQPSIVDTVVVKTDVSGRLSIIQNSNGLAGATMYITTPFTGTGNPITVEPNGQLLGKIQSTTTADVLNAKDKSGNYLLQDKYRTQANAESLAKIMQSSANLVEPDQQHEVVYFYHNRARSPLARTNGLNIAKNAGINWEIDFSSGFPVYRNVSSNDLRLYMANASNGIFGIGWGDVWDAIKGGFNAVVDGIKKIIVTIGSTIKVLFEIVVDGVTKVFESIVETAQQVFNLVEGVWNWLKVTTQKIYEWLAFFFNWEDIKRTAHVVEYNSNLFLDFTKASVEHLRGEAAQWIDGLKRDLNDAVDDFLAKYTDTSLGSIGNEYKEPQPEAENGMDHNPMFISYKENYKDTTVKASFAESFAESPINDLVIMLQDLANNFEFGDGKAAFDEAINYFSNIKDNPDKALDLLLSGLVKVGESIALFALDFGKGVILTMLDIIVSVIDAFKNLMNEEWEIPIVSEIYKLATGETLSFRPIQLLSYIIAIPANIIYKASEGVAPFPDEASVQAFKNYYTLDYLKKRAGLISGRINHDFSTAAAAAQESVARLLFKAGYAISMFVGSFADIATAIASSTGTVNDAVGYVSTGAGILSAVFTNPWILEVDPGKLICGSTGSSGSSGFNIGYVATAIGLLVPAAVYFYKKKNPATPPDVIVKINEISRTLVGATQTIIYIVEYATTSNPNGKVFARTLTATIPGKLLRFLSLKELNVEAFFIPVGILSVLIFGGYTAAFIINFSINPSLKDLPDNLELAIS